MANSEQRQQTNDLYLQAALTWLRLHLQRQIKSFEISANSAEFTDSNCEPINFDSAILQAQEAMLEAASQQPTPAFVQLQHRLKLTQFEQEILILCAAIELDTQIAGLCAHAQDNLHRPYPTFALACALFDNPEWPALSPDRPLRYWRLIEINQPGNQPLTTSPLRADERIVNHIKGVDYLDDRLSILLNPIPLQPANLSLSQQAVAEKILRQFQNHVSKGSYPIIQLLGTTETTKKLIASKLAQILKRKFYCLSISLLPAQLSEWEAFSRLWQRESKLLPIALYLELPGTINSSIDTLLKHFLERFSGILILSSHENIAEPGKSSIIFDITKPTQIEQQSAWSSALNNQLSDTADALAGQFNLDLPTIQAVSQSVSEAFKGDSEQLHSELWQTCLEITRPKLDGLAQRIELHQDVRKIGNIKEHQDSKELAKPDSNFGKLVLPKEQQILLSQLIGHVAQRNLVYNQWGFQPQLSRGSGITALFAGESGTGKTLAAEEIAKCLKLDLYRIDLSSVVSKYIGETEKNLRRLFDAAEDGGVILFFDEADALFGKRSEVQDSHDRYANIEINYLLQRMEAYRGLAILATNMKSALDPAFMRRLRFIINFPFPGKEERRRIWGTIFPKEAPIQDLDFERLSKLNLTGGSIQNIALNAAFMAAQLNHGIDHERAADKVAITMPIVLEATKIELRKLESPINEADFR